MRGYSSVKRNQTCRDDGALHFFPSFFPTLIFAQGAHWATLGDEIEVAANTSPAKSPVAYVEPSKFVNYKLNPDISMASRCVEMLKKSGLKAKLNQKFDWIHDTYLILIRMFPDGCPPTTIISMNARYDPHYHVKVGEALRPLRNEDVLFIGTGGAVHNLYRNNWYQMLRYRGMFPILETPSFSFAKRSTLVDR